MSDVFTVQLGTERRAELFVRFVNVRSDVADYSVVLSVDDGDERATVRLYDGAHGRNELHRYTRSGGKQPAEIFHRGTLGEGMRSAIGAISIGHEQMIDAWTRS